MEDAHKLLEIQKLERNLYGLSLAGRFGKNEKIFFEQGWEKIPNWECLFVHREKGLFSSMYVDDIELVGKNKIRFWCGKYSIKKSIWENQCTFFWSCILGLHSKTMRKKPRCCGKSQNHVLFTNFSGGIREITILKIFVFLHGLMTWLAMQRSVWNDIVSWRIRRLCNSIKYLLYALMISTSKRKETKSVGELSNTCFQIDLQCLYLTRIGISDLYSNISE